MGWFWVWYNPQVVEMSCCAMNPYMFHVLIGWVRSPKSGGSDSFME